MKSPSCRACWRDANLRGTVTTMDALLTQRALAHQIGAQHGYYLMVVKENQPALYAQIALLFNVPPVPVRPGELLTYSHTERSGHGPLGDAHLGGQHGPDGLPGLTGCGASHAAHLSAREIPRTGEVSSETTYGITSLGLDLAQPVHLEAFWAGAVDHRKQGPPRPRTKLCAGTPG